MLNEMVSGNKTDRIEGGALERSIDAATRGLLDYQRSDGHWVFELEADCTIPAEYVLLRHYLGRAGGRRARGQDRRLSATRAGRAWRLAAGS